MAKERIPKPDNFKPEPIFPKDHKWAGKPRCQAWNNTYGRQCKKMPMKVLGGGHPASPDIHSTVCELDGGKSLRGIASGRYKNGNYSRFAPALLEPVITAFLKSGGVLELQESIATWEARANQLLRSLDEHGDPGSIWPKLGRHLRAMWAAIDADDIDKALNQRKKIDDLFDRGKLIAKTWEGIKEADEMKRRLVDTEDKRRDRRKGYLAVEQARFHYHALGLAVIDALEEMIDDREFRDKVRREIADRFIKIASATALPRTVTDTTD